MTRVDLVTLAHLALSATFLIWDIVLAGRIAQQRSLSPFLTGLSALGGLLVAPAFLVFIASGSVMTGRSLHTIAWVWPVTTALIAAQAVYATATRRVSFVVGVPFVAYDTLVALTALAQYFVASGEPASRLPASLVSAAAIAQSGIIGPAAALSPLHTPIPLLAPAHPPRWRTVAWWRGVVASVALAWTVLVVAHVREGGAAVAGFTRFADAELRPRPGEPFAVGLEILPTLGGVPEPLVLRNDLALVGDAEIAAALVSIDPRSVTNLALDSLRRALEPMRRDSLLLITALRAPRDAAATTPQPSHETYVAAADRVARRLRPDYLLMLDGPRDAATAPVDSAGRARIDLLIRTAATAARRGHPRTRIALSIVPATPSDSALYAWAASPDSPIDAVGFTFLAGPRGVSELEAQLATAERWMRAVGGTKEHWVFRAGGLPAIHGELAQERAIAGILDWAMPRPGIRGAVLSHAGDYGPQRGLRAVSGRVRPAFSIVVRAGRETGR